MSVSSHVSPHVSLYISLHASLHVTVCVSLYVSHLNTVSMCLQASGFSLPPLQELWQPSAPSQHHLIVSPEALQQPRDGYKGNAVGSQMFPMHLVSLNLCQLTASHPRPEALNTLHQST